LIKYLILDKLNLEFDMINNNFETLLALFGNTIFIKDTSFKSTIPSCDSYHSLKDTFKMSKKIISTCIPEIFEALLNTLKYTNNLKKVK